MQTLTVKTKSHTDLKDITREVAKAVAGMKVESGVCVISVPDTTAGITINENADPSVRADIENTLDKLVPWSAGYSHTEGNSAAHIKSAMLGHSAMLPVRNGKLLLGTWQCI